MKKIILILTFNFIAAFFFVGCSHNNDQEIKIGVIAPLTGDGATYGQAMKEGVDIAIEEINKDGGIDGQKILAYYQDSKLSPKEGINAFNYLVKKEKVPAIIGAAGSSVSLAIVPFANSSKTVLISPISTADDLSQAGEYFFRNIPPNSFQAITAADFLMNDLKLKKFAIYYENNDYGKNMDNVFTNRINENGGKILISEGYESGQKDFKTTLQKIKATNPDAVFIPGTYQENAIILRQKTELKFNSVFIAGDGAYSPELLNIAGNGAEGFYLTMIDFNQTSDKYLTYKENFNKKYGKDPDVYSGFSYDIVYILSNVIKNSESTGESILSDLNQVDYEGVTGRNKFDENGDVQKPYRIFTVKNNEFVFYK